MSKPNYVCKTAFMVLHKKSLENLGITTDFSKQDDIIAALQDVAGADCDIGGSLAVSKDGLEHIHLAATYPKAKRIGGISKMWGNAHVDPQRGTKEQAEAYIKKEGKWEEKGEKVLKVFGDFNKCLTDRSGARTDLSIKDKLLVDRQKPNFSLDQWLVENVPDDKPQLWRYCQNVHLSKLISEVPPVREVTVNYIQGGSYSGKNFPIETHIPNIFKVNMANKEFPFDGYMGEEDIMFDELRPNQVKEVNTLLQWLDKYRVPLNLKGSRGMLNAKRIWITTAFNFEDWYKDGEKVKNVESITKIREQFRRRIDNVYRAENWKWHCEGHPKAERLAIERKEISPKDTKYFNFLDT